MNRQWPWSRPLRWTDVLPGGLSLAFTADDAERARVAEGLDVDGIVTLAATLEIKPWLDGCEVGGELRACVMRTCGVSLESFEECVDEPVALRFVASGSPNAPQAPLGDLELDFQAEDPPDVIDGDAIDLGAYMTEQLALALSPFPRKPGAEFQPPAASGTLSPFSALARLQLDTPEKE